MQQALQACFGRYLRGVGAYLLLQQRVPRTIVVAAEVEGRTTIEQWSVALAAVQAHHTLLSSRIRQRPGFRPCFELMPDAPLALQAVPSESGTRLFELVSAELATRFGPDDALLRTSILYGRDRTTLVLGAHHAALDGTSLTTSGRPAAIASNGFNGVTSLETRSSVRGTTMMSIAR